jgi:superfamily II DNA or RNA helicase
MWVLRGFQRSGDRMVEERPLPELDETELERRLKVPAQDARFASIPVSPKAAAWLEKFAGVRLDLDRSEYFLDYDDATTAATDGGSADLRIQELDELTGSDFENVIRRLVEKQGFEDVTSTPGSRDYGADLLAQRDGERYAIQVKRSVSPIGVAAIQQVLGGMAYWDAAKGLVVTNSLYTESAQELASRAEVDLVDRRKLKAWIQEAQLDTSAATVTPRPYQVEALDSLATLRSQGEQRALVVMASGLGKTYVAALDAERFQAKLDRPMRALYLSHQAVILEQALRSFRRVFGDYRSYGRFDADHHDLEADFLFGTFQSVVRSLQRFDPSAFDYLVVDEAHHTAAPTRDEVVSYFAPRFALGLTATPFRGDGKDIYSYYGDVVAISLTLERALAEGFLTPIDYRVCSDPVDADRLAAALRAASDRGGVFREENDQLIVETVLRDAEDTGEGRRVLVFCASLAQMDHFAEVFPEARAVSGRDSRARQVATIEAFLEGEFEVLLSRDVLNEGIDVPHASTLVFLRNTESAVVFMQQLGRGLRKVEGKERVVVLDFVNNLDRIEFLYSFFSRLEAEQDRVRRERRQSSGEGSTLRLDQTARDVINALLRKKIENEFVIDLTGLTAAVSLDISTATLRRIVDSGRLVPDFVSPDRRKLYFDRATVIRLVRQVQSPRFVEGLVPEREFAKAIGQPLGWVRDRQRHGNLPAAWIHRRPSGKIELYFTDEDVLRYRQTDS